MYRGNRHQKDEEYLSSPCWENQSAAGGSASRHTSPDMDQYSKPQRSSLQGHHHIAIASNGVHDSLRTRGKARMQQVFEPGENFDQPFEHDLTLRSLLLGSVLGIIFGTQNIYFGIKSGAAFGGPITVSLLGFAAMKALTTIFSSKLHFTIHENVILQTTAATGQSLIFTGGFSTYILAMSGSVWNASKQLGTKEDTFDITYLQGLAWLMSIVCLGFFMAQPMRKQLIVEKEYPWPTSTATAIVISSLHSSGGVRVAKTLVTFLMKVTVVSFCWYWFKWIFDGKEGMSTWPIFGKVAADKYLWTLDWSTAYIGSGILLGFISAWSMFVGACFMFGFITPIVASFEGVWFPENSLDFQGIKAYYFLPALTITVVDSFYQVLKILVQLAIWSKNSAEEEEEELVEDPKDEIPVWFWLSGFLVNAAIVCITTPLLFDVPWYMCLVCLALGPIIGYGINIGAALTDVALISAIGKFIIIAFGSWTPSIVTILWLAGIGMASVGSSTDLLADYRTAFLTGTPARSMLKAQVFGAFVAAFITPITYLTLKDAYPITANGAYTAPGAVLLRALATLFVNGFQILPPNVLYFVIVFGVWTVVNNLLIDLLPEKYTVLLPNCMAFAIGGQIRPSYGLNSMIGYLIKVFWSRIDKEKAATFGPALGGGMIAGEGLAAVLSALVTAFDIPQPRGIAISFGPPPGSA